MRSIEPKISRFPEVQLPGMTTDEFVSLTLVAMTAATT
jgi:hypothetical protein